MVLPLEGPFGCGEKKEKSFKNGDIEGFSSLVFVFFVFLLFFFPMFRLFEP